MTSSPATAVQAASSEDIYGAQIYKRPRRMTVRMRAQGWRDACLAKGINSDNVLGSLLSYNPSHIYRVRVGQSTPGAEFIATAINVFDRSFEELFEVVDRELVTDAEEDEPA